MSNPLSTYLRDHLAGSKAAIDLIEYMAEQNAGEPLGRFAKELAVEVEEDQATLRELMNRINAKGNPLKEASTWLGEKATRIKLNHRTGSGLGTLQALETIALGIQGKLALWKALESTTNQFSDIDFPLLAERARSQHDRVERHRLEQAQKTFA